MYALPLDDVLTQTTALLSQQGWPVQRSGDKLVTSWLGNATGYAISYRVYGDRIDSRHCRIQVLRLVATPTNVYTEPRLSGWQMSQGRRGDYVPPPDITAADTPNESAAGTNPPFGLVVTQHARDQALELAFQEQIEPASVPSAQRTETLATALSQGSAADGGLAASPAPSGHRSAPQNCEPRFTGVESPVVEKRLILLGDIPGTNEIPDAVRRLACQAAEMGIPTLVALELLQVDQEWVDTYFASGGSASDRAAFLQIARTFKRTGSGQTQAVLGLLDRLRGLRDAGLSIRVVAFDVVATAPERSKTRASNLERLRRAEPDALLLVVVERSQARTTLGPSGTPESAPMGWYLSRWGLRPLSLDVHSPGGQRWSCKDSGPCGPVPVPATPSTTDSQSERTVMLFPKPDAEGFQGAYFVGPLTASSAPKP
ncbi:MAG: hypothetical protein ACLPJH_05225 [Myxococcaceae bacterium]